MGEQFLCSLEEAQFCSVALTATLTHLFRDLASHLKYK